MDELCFMCKGQLEDGFTTFMTDLGTCIVIIKNVPAKICSQCGEVSYSDEVAKKIQKIINGLRDSITEVAITDYKTAA
ncbi:MAG: type II toxin-antitoxin system MqsA family antitoxin [Treponema sp.]|nr:type II toxin-antitoxin system MqsA family antitoxin [Candidatus Treponema equifaecale]